MSGEPSMYFTLFKKFQLMGHVPEANMHGGPMPSFIDLNDPTGLFNPIGGTAPINTASTLPDQSPLYLLLKARADNVGTDTSPVAGTPSWKRMPQGSPPSWTEFQGPDPSGAAGRLVKTFADWIAAGPARNDTPSGVIGLEPPPIGATDAGVVKLFVCNSATDDGTTPLPVNWWATSLIFLVDPATGIVTNPANLDVGHEYELVAIVGNRGANRGGQWVTSGPNSARSLSKAKALAQGWVAIWNSGFSPGVLLPSLTNLHHQPVVSDPDSLNPDHELYWLEGGRYDVVGFRLNVESVFDGLAKELLDSGTDLGGLTPGQWLTDSTHGAHLCTQVRIKGDTTSQLYPPFSESLNTLPPDQQHRIAQKNLMPFNISLATDPMDPNPAISFLPWMTGSMRMMEGLLFDEEIANWLRLVNDLSEGFRLFLAMPAGPFLRLVQGEDALEGFRVVKGLTREGSRDDDAELSSFHGRLMKGRFEFKLEDEGSWERTFLVRGKGSERFRAPFREFVMLEAMERESVLRLPHTGEEFVAMALGIEYDRTKLREGRPGDITVIQEGTVPVFEPKERCYILDRLVLGGFTIEVRVEEPRKIDPRWELADGEWYFLEEPRVPENYEG
jgi:hypothetical protein